MSICVAYYRISAKYADLSQQLRTVPGFVPGCKAKTMILSETVLLVGSAVCLTSVTLAVSLSVGPDNTQHLMIVSACRHGC